MKSYFHATSSANVASILRLGLDPTRMADELLGEDEEPEPFVFLAESPSTASDFGNVLLHVHLPDDIESSVRHDLGEFARCPVLIQPTWIEVFRA